MTGVGKTPKGEAKHYQNRKKYKKEME